MKKQIWTKKNFWVKKKKIGVKKNVDVCVNFFFFFSKNKSCLKLLELPGATKNNNMMPISSFQVTQAVCLSVLI